MVAVGLLAALSTYGVLVVKKQIFPYPQLLPVARNAFRYVQTVRMGREGYVAAILRKQRVKGAPTETEKTIETSQLPLKLKFLWLGATPGFPEGGGAVADIGKNLVVMSRTGTFYKVSNGRLEQLDYGLFPNRIDDYILSSKAGLNSDAMRAHALAYDAVNSRLVVGYTRYVSPEFNRFVISALPVDPVTLQKRGEWKDLFESENVVSSYASQAGAGRVIISKGKIFFSTGYAEVPTTLNGKKVPAAQNPNSSFGKMFEFDLQTGELRQLSMGHRNVQGIAVSSDGDLLAAEQGPEGGDEINLIKEGKNYGWPYTTYGTDYGHYSYTPEIAAPKGFVAEDPVYAFVPSVGLSPIHTMKGFHPRWEGNIMAGSLKSQSLFRLVFKAGRVIISEPIWIGHRIRDITQSPATSMVLLTDDSYLIFVTVDEDALRNDKRDAGYNFEPKLVRCLVCHHFEQTTPSSTAPSLAHVIGRKIGGDTFPRYSSAFQHAQGVWDEDKLAKFILDPQTVVPGTAMPKLGLSESEAVDIAKILARQ